MFKKGWVEQVMAPRRKRFIAVLIITILTLVAGGLVYLLWDGSLGGVSKEPTGTWSVEESFPGSPMSDFTVTVHNLKGATHFELHVDDVQIDERVTLDGSIRSVSLIFSKPEMMEVRFFDSLDATEPIARARCHQSGDLIFSGSEGSLVGDRTTGAGKKDDNSRSSQPSKNVNDLKSELPKPEGGKSDEGLLDRLKRWFSGATARLLTGQKAKEPRLEVNDQEKTDQAPSIEGNSSEGKQEYDPPGAGKPAGRWSVEPDTPPTALFQVSVVNIDPKACYELQASGIAVGKRVRLDKSICSISLMFSEPSLLKVTFFADMDTPIVLAEAGCTEEGALKFIE